MRTARLIVALAGVLLLSLTALASEDENSTQAEVGLRQAGPDSGLDQGEPDGKAVPAAVRGYLPYLFKGPTLAAITVAYRLDPWLISGNYGAGFWVSPTVFGPVTQGGNTFTLEVRAQGLDARGEPVVISPEWVPADPEMVTVSPPQGSVVTLTVQRAGQSSLHVTEDGVSREVSISAAYQGSAILVKISQ